MAFNPDLANYPNFISFASTPRTNSYAFIQSTEPVLAGKSVFITGASQGVGRQIALAFARAGCSRIAITSRSSDKLQAVSDELRQAAQEAGRDEPQVLALRLDVTSKDDVKAAVKSVSEAFDGKLDVLINNAGYLDTFNYVADSEPDDWWHTWEVNVKGTYLVTQIFLPLILESSLKAVVTMTSGMGLFVSPGNTSYTTAKMALCKFAETLAAEYGSTHGLVAYAYEPGLTDTEMATKMHPQMYALPKDDPSLAADTMVWLVKEKRDWLSGRIVSARWDMEEACKRKDEVVEKNLLKMRVSL